MEYRQQLSKALQSQTLADSIETAVTEQSVTWRTESPYESGHAMNATEKEILRLEGELTETEMRIDVQALIEFTPRPMFSSRILNN
jgi:hypothetical protein